MILSLSCFGWEILRVNVLDKWQFQLAAVDSMKGEKYSWIRRSKTLIFWNLSLKSQKLWVNDRGIQPDLDGFTQLTCILICHRTCSVDFSGTPPNCRGSTQFSRDMISISVTVGGIVVCWNMSFKNPSVCLAHGMLPRNLTWNLKITH